METSLTKNWGANKAIDLVSIGARDFNCTLATTDYHSVSRGLLDGLRFFEGNNKGNGDVAIGEIEGSLECGGIGSCFANGYVGKVEGILSTREVGCGDGSNSIGWNIVLGLVFYAVELSSAPTVAGSRVGVTVMVANAETDVAATATRVKKVCKVFVIRIEVNE